MKLIENTMTDDELMARALVVAQSKIAEADNRIAELESENDEMRPKAEYYDDLVDAGHCTNLRDTAKELGIGQNELVAYLLSKGYLFRDDNKKLRPYAKHTVKEGASGMFVLKEAKCDHNSWTGVQTLVTVKGKQILRNNLNKKHEGTKQLIAVNANSPEVEQLVLDLGLDQDEDWSWLN